MIGALAAWLAVFAVDVVGDVACPAPAEVSRRLAEIAPPADPWAASGRRVHLWRDQRALHLELRSDAGERIGERDLDANERCDDLAQAAAIVIAAWEAELDPRVTSKVDLPRSAPPIVTAAEAPPAPRGSPPPSFDAGLALLASVAGGQVAPGARIEARAAPGGRHLGFGVTLSGATARSTAVGAQTGAARWTRIALGVGPDARFDAGRTMLGVHAQLLAGALQVEGVGLDTNASDTSSQLGAGMGVQMGRPWGNATPWIGVDVLYWLGHDRLEISGLTAHGELPHLEVQIAAGLSLGRFP